MRTILFAALLAVGFAAPAGAQVATSEIDHSQATFEQVLSRTAAFLHEGAYNVEVASQWKTSGTAQGASGASTYRLWVERPAKFRIEIQSAGAPAPELLCASDGEVVTTLLAARKLYSKSPAASGLQHNTLLAMSLAGSGVDVLLQPNLVAFVHSQVTGVKHAQTVKDGQPLHHFRMQWAQGDLELWIAAAGPPVPQQFRRTVVVPAPDGSKYTLTTTTQWKWHVGESAADGKFAVQLPDGARRVADIYAALAGDDSAARIGKQLPELKLTGLDGSSLKLAPQEKAASVFIFWASWCAPSVSDLAGVSDFIKQYSSRGAQFYAVNVGESIDDVRRFASGKSLQSTIVLDSSGHASAALGIVDLPAAVVVDSSGKVLSVARGSGKEVLLAVAKELEPLLAKSQVAEEHKPGAAQR
jgi:peroxiredoxin